jgi:hypothetical protein
MLENKDVAFLIATISSPAEFTPAPRRSVWDVEAVLPEAVIVLAATAGGGQLAKDLPSNVVAAVDLSAADGDSEAGLLRRVVIAGESLSEECSTSTSRGEWKSNSCCWLEMDSASVQILLVSLVLIMLFEHRNWQSKLF